MIWNQIKVVVRTFRRNPTFSALNLFGLTIGLTSSLLIFLYIHHEQSYDQFLDDKERIYRVPLSFKAGDGYTTTTTSPFKVAEVIGDNIPEIESSIRMYYAFNSRYELTYQDRSFTVTDQFTYVDPNFFDFFSFPLIQGNAASVLSEPNTIVLSKSESTKIFQGIDPIGKTIQLTSAYNRESIDLKVTGVMEDIPVNSHIPYSYFISMETAINRWPSMTTQWGWTSQNTYVKLATDATVDKVTEQFPLVLADHAPEWFVGWAQLQLQPLTDIHLHSHLKEELKAGGDATYIRLLRIIAIFIIGVAVINYMNLATSMASKRVKEIGIKKIVGANRAILAQQFLLEALIMLLIAFILSITIAQLSLPLFNQLASRSLSLLDFPATYVTVGIASVFVIGLIAGSYPSFFLSSFRATSALVGDKFRFNKQNVLFRKILVITQFVISTFLICATLIILNQWNYLRDLSLGIDTEQVMTLSLHSESAMESYPTLRNELLRNAEFLNVGTCSKSISGRFDGFNTFGHEGVNINFPIEFVDEYFFQTAGIELIEGRYLDDRPSDSSAVVVNKAVLEQLSIKDPIGKLIDYYDETVRVVGVVEDFHFEPLYTEISPLIFMRSHLGANFAYLKVNMQHPSSTLQKLESVWNEVNPETQLEFRFANDEINRSYQAEGKFFQIFVLFSALAIFVACLGLFGLVSFSVSQKVKEIGIRKVLGASAQSIIYLLAKGFLGLILVSGILSWPIIYVSMGRWLEKFPYRTTIELDVLLTGTFAILLVAVLVIGGQAFKASRTNPVNSLRNE